MSSKTNKGVAWLYNEVCALLDIWADQEIQQQLAGRLHNMCIYEKISKRLTDLGIHRTGEQCREKIKKLRRDYKTVVDNNYSPAFARKMLVCYDKVHEIFGKCAVLKPSFVIESIVYNENILNNGNEILTDKHSDIITEDNSNLQLNKHLDMHEKKHAKDSLNVNTCQKKYSAHFNNVFKQSHKTGIQKFKKKIKNSVEKQAFLHRKLLKRQTTLHNKFIELEKKRFNDELICEHNKLIAMEAQRRKEKEQEIELFKSLLQIIKEKKT
ncbi:uncharacterized protein TNCT_88351 [Trichonephila clavata]|uniref:Myb/SANT-like DNA-binding domain-containing protein n=1 Tax=Trichonephila clavata TaxID=2740835 RepID=A0A8X6F8E0_TRICU|nr:uncharacterized protein TNCT_88351 [Trichonephila clavata]